MIYLLAASITYVRGMVQTVTVLPFKVRTGLVTGWSGDTFNTTDNDLSTGIFFLTMLPVNAEVLGIIKGSLVIPVR